MAEVGFHTNLLGKPSHDALVKLQEHEIKFLEVMKKTLTMRIKCDREYANSLTQVALQGARIESPDYSSPLYMAWKELVQEFTQASQTIKKGADQLQTSALDKVVGLIKDKVTMKKYYLDNRDRIDSDLLKVIHTEMDKKGLKYQSLETDVTKAKTAYENAVKDKKAKLQAIEKAQDKYRKTTMKFHHAHNEYVLQVMEAQIHQDQYRRTILPNLLGGVEYLENTFVDTVKGLISDILENTSPCRDELVSSHKEAENKLREIDPYTEYSDFLANKFSSLEQEAQLNFDCLKGEGSRLPNNQIFLNSLSLQGIEHMAQGFQSDRTAIESQIESYNQHLADLHQEIQQFSENLSNISLHEKRLDYVTTQLRQVEQQSLLEKQGHQLDALDRCLSDLGNDDPPRGLDLPDLDTLSTTSDIKSPTEARGSSLSSKFNFNKLKSSMPSLSKWRNNKEENRVIVLSKTEREQSWFHGAIPRPEAERMVQKDGDFLLRASTTSGEFVLTGKSANKIRHFKFQKTDEGLFRFDSEAFPTIVELLNHYYVNRLVITGATNCLLLNAICKDKWQLSHDDLEMGEKLGQGHFGTVVKALLRTTNEWVAVKTCKETLDSVTKDKFLLEAKILKGYEHPNIVTLIGICTDRQPIYIVMELVTGGDLTKYLKKFRFSLQERQLMQMCRDASSGLAYLEEKKCIHRDVAARNCLINDRDIVKITDFGMSREEEDGVYSVSGSMKQVPMKWTAPEALNFGKFTSASDVWSFGILSWEIFSYAEQPYQGMTNQHAREQVENGYRMPCPNQCPRDFYDQVIVCCWEYESDRRPRFAQIISSIDVFLHSDRRR